MILEDESTGKIYKDYLMSALPNHEFVWCRNIASAQKAIDETFSVVVLDQRLEENTAGTISVELGTTFMCWCKEKYPHIVGIMLSTHVTKEALAEAYDKQWISKYLEKDKKGLADLPGEVAVAIDNSECLRVTEKTASSPQRIGTFRTWRTLFSPMRVYKISEYVVDDQFVDNNTWETIKTIHAGQKKVDKRKIQISNTITVKCDATMSAVVSADILTSIIKKNIKLDSNISCSINSESSETYIAELEESFEMPPISSDPNTVSLSTMKIEANRIYEVRTIGLKISCPVCQSDKYISCEVRVPTNRIKHRKIYIYSDGTSKELDA